MVPFESLGVISYSNYGSILHQFRDKARYWSKILIFSLHTCIRRPRLEVPVGIFPPRLVLKTEDKYNRLDTIPACDRRTDGHLATCHGIVSAMHTLRAVKNASISLTVRTPVGPTEEITTLPSSPNWPRGKVK